MTGRVRPVRWQVLTSLGVLLLGVIGTSVGLFWEGFYTDPEALRVQAYGQDLVTMVVVLPALALGLWLGRRGSLRGYFLWLGAVGYMAYTYFVYAVITDFNWFFLGYVAIFGLSTYTLVGGLLQTDAGRVKDALEPSIRARLIAVFFAAMGVLVAALWLGEVIPATLANVKPQSVASVGLPANVIHVLDLGVLIPAMFVTAWWVSQRRAWGYVLAGVLFVKIVSITLAVLGMIVWMTMQGETVAPAEIAVFGLVTLVGILVGAIYFRALSPSKRATSD